MVGFEWDPGKARRNFRKHRVSFREAATGFRDPLGITIDDPEHSDEEERYITIGTSNASRLLMVAHTDRVGKVRIISARKLASMERQAYGVEIQRRKG